MAAHPRFVYKRRATITDLPLYYSGHLFKKHIGDKDFKKFYGELRGPVLFLYENDTQDTYTERLDLDQVKSTRSNSPVHKTAPVIITFTTSTKEIQLKIDNPDTGEEWRGYILTLVKKEIPSELRLLPGQIRQLQETLAQEKKRITTSTNPPLPPRPPFLSSSDNSNSQGMPECFFSVSREDAEEMLEKNPEFGHIILRPSARVNSYAVTLRQLTSSGPVLKNYRITSIPGSGFIIELDSPVKVQSLNEVISYVLKQTEYRLQPYTLSQPYDTKLEKPLIPPSASTVSPTSKNIPKAEVSPTVHTKKDMPVKSALKPVDNEYVIPQDESKNKTHDSFDGELREALQKRRGWIYSSKDAYEANP